MHWVLLQQLSFSVPSNFQMFNQLFKEYDEPKTYIKIQLEPHSKHSQYRFKN